MESQFFVTFFPSSKFTLANECVDVLHFSSFFRGFLKVFFGFFFGFFLGNYIGFSEYFFLDFWGFTNCFLQ